MEQLLQHYLPVVISIQYI